jgi:phage-related protein
MAQWNSIVKFTVMMNTVGAKALQNEMRELNVESNRYLQTMRNLSNQSLLWGGIFTTAVTTPIVAGFKKAVMTSADYHEELNKMQVVYGDLSGEVDKWVNTVQKTHGLSRVEAMTSVSAFGDMGKSLNMTTQDAMDMATQLVERGRDIESFKNMSSEMVNTAMKGIYTGETESLKNLPVIMTEAAIASYMVAEGLASSDNEALKMYKSMEQSEKVAIRFGKFMHDTSLSAGDFYRTLFTEDPSQASIPNALRLMKSLSDDLFMVVGDKLRPVFAEFLIGTIGLMEKFKGYLEDNVDKVIKWGVALASIGPLLLGFGIGLKVLGALSGAIGGILTLIGFITKDFALAKGVVVALEGALSGLVTSIMTFGGATVPLIGGLGLIDSKLGALIKNVAMFNLAMGAIFFVILPVVALTYAFVDLYNTSWKVRDAVSQTFNSIKLLGTQLLEVIKLVAKAYFEGFLGKPMDEDNVTTTILDIKKGIDDLTVFLQANKDKIADFFRIIGATARELWDIVTGLGDKLIDVFSWLSDKLGGDDNAIEFLLKLGLGIYALATALGIIGGLISVVTGAIAGLSGVFSALGVVIKVVATVFGALVGFFGLIPVLIGIAIGLVLAIIWNFRDEIGAFFSGLWTWITETAEKWVLFVEEMWQSVVTFFEGLWTWFTELPGKVLEWMTSVKDNVVNSFNDAVQNAINFLNGLKTWWDNLVKQIVAWMHSIKTNIINNFNNAVNGALDFLRGILTWFQELPGKISSFISSIPGVMSSLFNNAKEVTVNAVKGIVDWFKDLPGTITEVLSGIPAQMGTIGSQIVQGLIGGMGNLASELAGKVAGAVDGVKNLLGIKSPSRLFKYFGNMMADGMTIGFDDNIEELNIPTPEIDSVKKMINLSNGTTQTSKFTTQSAIKNINGDIKLILPESMGKEKATTVAEEVYRKLLEEVAR